MDRNHSRPPKKLNKKQSSDLRKQGSDRIFSLRRVAGERKKEEEQSDQGTTRLGIGIEIDTDRRIDGMMIDARGTGASVAEMH